MQHLLHKKFRKWSPKSIPMPSEQLSWLNKKRASDFRRSLSLYSWWTEWKFPSEPIILIERNVPSWARTKPCAKARTSNSAFWPPDKRLSFSTRAFVSCIISALSYSSGKSATSPYKTQYETKTLLHDSLHPRELNKQEETQATQTAKLSRKRLFAPAPNATNFSDENKTQERESERSWDKQT